MNENISLRLKRHATDLPTADFCSFSSSGRLERITFSQLYARSGAYAREYLALGVAPGDLVLVMLEHTPHLYYAFLGAVMAGAVPSFMPFPSPKQRPDLFWSDHQTLFARIQPRLLVTSESIVAQARAVGDVGFPALVTSDEILRRDATENDDLPGFSRLSNTVACLQHSSGTTGLKKGVMLTHEAIISQVDSYARAIDFSAEDSIASWLPLYHDMGFIACFMMSVVRGTHLYSIDPFEWTFKPRLLLDTIAKNRCTFTWLPNFAFSHIANAVPPDAQWDLSSMKAFINCSEPCKIATFDRFLARFSGSGVEAGMLQVCYAMAENVFAVTQTSLGELPRTAPRPDAPQTTALSCGTPIEGVRVRVQGGEVGEIEVSGEFLFDGYYLLPEKTAERMQDGWYRTGDLGFMRDGELYVTGRVDDMLVVNGRNFYAHEIEDIMNEISYVLPGRCVAFGVDNDQSDALAVIVLVECALETDSAQATHAVRQHIFDRIGLMIHSAVALMPGQLVKTTSGKFSREKNRRLYLDGAFIRREHSA